MPQVINDQALELLKSEIQKSGLKKNFIAGKLGMTDSRFSSFLTGRTKLSIEFLMMTSKVIGIDYRIFLNKSYTK